MAGRGFKGKRAEERGQEGQAECTGKGQLGWAGKGQPAVCSMGGRSPEGGGAPGNYALLCMSCFLAPSIN